MKHLLLLITLIISSQLFAQNASDTNTVHVKDTSHSFKKAALFSAVIPGAGQVYNHLAMPKGKKKAFWKVPIIYAGLGATTYFMVQNHLMQRDLKAEYVFRQKSNFSQMNDSRFYEYDEQGVLTLYEQHQRNRDLLIIGMGAVYLLQILDAAVEAHFVKFDISEDLTMRVTPTALGLQTIGVKFAFNFR